MKSEKRTANLILQQAQLLYPGQINDPLLLTLVESGDFPNLETDTIPIEEGFTHNIMVSKSHSLKLHYYLDLNNVMVQ